MHVSIILKKKGVWFSLGSILPSVEGVILSVLQAVLVLGADKFFWLRDTRKDFSENLRKQGISNMPITTLFRHLDIFKSVDLIVFM